MNKGDVLNEVAKTTAYSGAKMTGEEGAYERIFTTKSDREMLERFWTECQVSVCETLKKFLQQEETTDDGWNLELGLSESFDDTLTKSIKKELFSFFVTGIVAKWYVFTNKKEAGDFGTGGKSILDEVKEKAFFKKKPTRPTYD